MSVKKPDHEHDDNGAGCMAWVFFLLILAIIIVMNWELTSQADVVKERLDAIEERLEQ